MYLNALSFDDLGNELLKAGADIFLTDMNGRTAMNYIKSSEYELRSSFTLNLICGYLKTLFDYFHNSTSASIQNDIQLYIDRNDESRMAVKYYHLNALQILTQIIAKNANLVFDTKFTTRFYFLPFFIGFEFRKKFLKDVQNKMIETNLKIDGELLAVKRARAAAKNKIAQIDEIEKVVERVGKRRRILERIFNLTLNVQNSLFILNMANQIFSSSFTNCTSNDFNYKLNEYINNF